MSRMSLSSVTTGKVSEPFKLVVYGKLGLGKSTFGASAPKPIVMDVEASTTEIDVARFPRPETLQDIRDGLRSLLTEQHGYQSLVLDTLDAAEQLIWDEVIRDARKDSKYANITTLDQVGGGYGKGPAAALMLWRLLLADMDALVEKRGMNVILLGHSMVKKFKSADVAVEPFDRYELKLLPGAAALVSEWPKAVMFADYEIMSTDKNGKVYGVSTGARILHTQHAAAWDAKNRYSLPETLPLSWAEFEKAVNAGRSTSQSSLVDEIRVLAEKAPEDVKKQVPGIIERAGGDVNKLNQAKSWIASKIA